MGLDDCEEHEWLCRYCDSEFRSEDDRVEHERSCNYYYERPKSESPA